MKKLFICLMLFVVIMPNVFAELKDIDDIPIKIIWEVAKDSNGAIYNITINVSSSEDSDHKFNKVITNTTANSSDTINIDIERNVPCEEEDIGNLTRTLIDSNIRIASTINNSFNFPKEHQDCIEGRSILSEKNKVYLQERDKFKNESDLYQGLYKDEQGAKDQVRTNLDKCNSDLLTRNTDYNACDTNLKKAEKKPSQYAMISIIITLIAVNLYNKSKEPKMPETFQFQGR